MNNIDEIRWAYISHRGDKTPALPAWMIPTITPKRPRADPKISMIRIFTKVEGV